MYVATKVAPITRSPTEEPTQPQKLSKIEKPKPFPTHKGLANAVWPMSSCNQYSREKLHSHKSGKPFPTHTGMSNTVWPLSSCNVHHESTVSGRGGQYSCTLHFLYMPSCRVTAKLYINRTNSPLLQMVPWINFIWSRGGQVSLHCLASFIYNRVG